VSAISRLVADIGGTNSRLALFDAATGELRNQQNFVNREHASFGDVVGLWLENIEGPSPAECCLAIAAPPFEDRVIMLNMDWSFSLSELGQRFGFDRIGAVNDFVGNAYSLPHLPAVDLHTLRPGASKPHSRLATMGPGTGLGGCTLDRSGSRHIAAHCEPGHMGLAPDNQLETDVFRALLGHSGEVYAELVLAGPGLVRLYRAMAEVEGLQAMDLSPAEVSRLALDGKDQTCVASLNTFCALLGSVCGDFVLCNGAFGGLYLAGGIVPGIIDFLAASEFANRFSTKGKMTTHLEQVPLQVITGGRAGLIGAAHAPL